MSTDKTQPKKLFADEDHDDVEAPRSVLPVIFLALVFLAGGGVVLLVQVFSKKPPSVRVVDLRKTIADANSAPLIDTPMMLPGISRPPAFSPEESFVSDSKQVLGVTVGEKHRAYLLDGLMPLGQRVINDLVGDLALTVLYDPQKDIPRLLGASPRDEPLKFNLGGYMDGDMFVMYRGRELKIEAKMPFKDYTFERVTWKEWKDNHPDTDIYTGRDIEIPFSLEAEAREREEAAKKAKEREAAAKKEAAAKAKGKEEVAKKEAVKKEAVKKEAVKKEAVKKEAVKKAESADKGKE